MKMFIRMIIAGCIGFFGALLIAFFLAIAVAFVIHKAEASGSDQDVVREERLSDRRESSSRTVRVARPLEEDRRTGGYDRLPQDYKDYKRDREDYFDIILEDE